MKIEVFQVILKGEVSLYCWPPVWLVWNQLYDNWQFLFYLQNILIQTSQTEGRQYNDSSPFSIPWVVRQAKGMEQISHVWNRFGQKEGQFWGGNTIKTWPKFWVNMELGTNLNISKDGDGNIGVTIQDADTLNGETNKDENTLGPML